MNDINKLREIALEDLHTCIIVKDGRVVDHPMFMSKIQVDNDGTKYDLEVDSERDRFISIKEEYINKASGFAMIAAEYEILRMIDFLKNHYELANESEIAYVLKALIMQQYFKVLQDRLGKELTLELLRKADRKAMMDRKLPEYIIVYRGKKGGDDSNIEYDGGIFACEVPDMVLINQAQFVDTGDTEVAGFKIHRDNVLAYVNVTYHIKNKETGQKVDLICGVCAMDCKKMMNLASEKEVDDMMTHMRGELTEEEKKELAEQQAKERSDRIEKLVYVVRNPNRNLEWTADQERTEVNKSLDYIVSEGTWLGIRPRKLIDLQVDYMLNFLNVEAVANQRIEYLADHAGWETDDSIEK